MSYCSSLYEEYPLRTVICRNSWSDRLKYLAKGASQPAVAPVPVVLATVLGSSRTKQMYIYQFSHQGSSALLLVHRCTNNRNLYPTTPVDSRANRKAKFQRFLTNRIDQYVSESWVEQLPALPSMIIWSSSCSLVTVALANRACCYVIQTIRSHLHS